MPEQLSDPLAEMPAYPLNPGNRTFVSDPQLPKKAQFGSPFQRNGQAPKYQPFNAVVAAGTEITFPTNWLVECWIIGVVPAASVRVQIAAGESASGDVLLFGGGGSAKIPGDGTSLAIRNTGANPATVCAVATAGYSWSLDYDPGDLA